MSLKSSSVKIKIPKLLKEKLNNKKIKQTYKNFENSLDIKQNFVALNISHPLYIASETSTKALQVHMAYTVVEAVVNAQAEKKSLTIEKASELRTKILTEIKDKLWL